MAQVTATRADRLDIPRPDPPGAGRLDRRLRAPGGGAGAGDGRAGRRGRGGGGDGGRFRLGTAGAGAWGVWVAWVVAASGPLARALARGLAGKARALDLAAVLERGYPELGERLTGAVGLLGGAAGAHGSPALIAAMADDASAHADGLDTARAAPAGGALAAAGAGARGRGPGRRAGVVRPDPYGEARAEVPDPLGRGRSRRPLRRHGDAG